MKKIFLIPLLALLCTVTAWAETVQVASKADLTSALSNANADVIQLTADIMDADSFTIKRSLTLDLNNHTISQPSANKAGSVFTLADAGIDVTIKNGTITRVSQTYSPNGSAAVAFTILASEQKSLALHNVNLNNGYHALRLNTGSCEIIGGSITGNMIGVRQVGETNTTISGCKITATGNYGIQLEGSGSLDVGEGTIVTGTKFAGISVWDNTTLNVTGGYVTGYYYGIATNGSGSLGANIFISGGSIFQDVNIWPTGAAIFHPAGNISISGSAEITGATGVMLCSGKNMIANMAGGKITATGEDKRTGKTYKSGLIPCGSAIAICDRSYPGGTPSMNITGGTFVSEQGQAVMAFSYSQNTNYVATLWEDALRFFNISGGVFSSDPSAIHPLPEDNVTTQSYIMDGYSANATTYDGQTMYMVVKGDVEEKAAFTANDEEAVKLTADVTVGNGTSETTEAADYVEVAADKTLTVADNATLNVGNGGLVLAESGSKFVIEEGGIATVGANGIISTDESNIEINLGENKQGALLIDPNVTLNTQPLATVKLKTNCKMLAGDPAWEYKYQRFAIPVKNAVRPTDDFAGTLFPGEEGYGFESYVFSWNGNTWGTNRWEDLEPFVGYQLANNSNEGNVTYTFTGNLLGNNDGSFDFTEKGFDFFGNSYTAPIYIKNFLEGFGSDVEASVWVYNNDGSQFEVITLEDIEDGFATKTEINSMEGFILNLRNANTGSAPVDYSSAIWGNPRFDAALGRSSAPARKNSAEPISNSVVVTITAENGMNDKVTLVEKAKYSSAFENGADASKYMYDKGINLYAVAENENLSRVATDDLTNTALSFRSGNTTNYTMTFSNVSGEDYMLRDNVTGQLIAFDGTYSFTQSANTIAEGRFQIVEAAKVPTVVDNVEVKANVKGIYTIMGQYVGEDLNALPAGLYIVNGVKIVK